MSSSRDLVHRPAIGLLAVAAMAASLLVSNGVRAAVLAGDDPGEGGAASLGVLAALATVDHLVISEVQTGGASASDEFVELYNPTAEERSLDGLELVYVTASGATITRKAAWGAGAAVGPFGHVLVANEAGIYAAIADATYANGLAATGGSMALRAVGASTPVDAVGWGTAASTWLEGTPAAAPAAGSSIERLPGGDQGSGQDSGDNAVDFVVRLAPEPQNASSPPTPDPAMSPSPSATASPSPSETPAPTPEPTPPTPEPTPDPTPEVTATPTPEPTPTPDPPTPSPTPSATPLPILTVAEARALPDGTTVTVSGLALTDSTFTEGGGYVADATGGIAVLVDGGGFARGSLVVVSGVVDDRYAQRTIRADGSGISPIGAGDEPAALPVATGAVGEVVEGQLVAISGWLVGTPTSLSSGLAFDLDDGSGAVRILVGPMTGIDTSAWIAGAGLELVGVVGQRDASGNDDGGYRVQPRDSADIGLVMPPPTPTPTPTPTPIPTPTPTPTATPTPSASPSPSAAPLPPLVSIAEARAADVNTRLRIRGVVTLPSGLLDDATAVVADASGAIMVRIGSEAGTLARGQWVELNGTRSTKSGMLTLRISVPATVLGTQAEPDGERRATGAVGETDEATLVIVRGLVADGPRKSTSGGLSFTVNDGSGALRVFVAAATRIRAGDAAAGSWIEVRGVVGQETTGAEPRQGYRLWPRDASDLRVVAAASRSGGTASGTSGSGAAAADLSDRPGTGVAGLANLRAPVLRAGDAEAVPPSTGPSSPAPAAAASRTAATARLAAPLAAGVGSLAGLAVLGWRRGTWRRLRDEVEVRATAWPLLRRGEGDREGESYTPPP